MTDTPINPDREAWANARNLEDLGNLTADWLEGTNTYMPSIVPDHDDTCHADRETAEIMHYLARANRNGYVTTDSQPGRVFTDGGGQRACVIGFTSETTARRIHQACRDTGLFTLTTPPGVDYGNNIAITLDDNEAFAWAGFVIDHDNIDFHYGQSCPNAVDALKAAWQVTIIDTEWERRELLWERLDTAWQ